MVMLILLYFRSIHIRLELEGEWGHRENAWNADSLGHCLIEGNGEVLIIHQGGLSIKIGQRGATAETQAGGKN